MIFNNNNNNNNNNNKKLEINKINNFARKISKKKLYLFFSFF